MTLAAYPQGIYCRRFALSRRKDTTKVIHIFNIYSFQYKIFMDGDYFAEHLLNMSDEAKRFIDDDAPVIMGKIARDVFTENFQDEGFTDTAFEPWEEVKRRLNPKTTGAKASRPILTGETGDLGMSIEYQKTADGETTIVSDKKYSKANNEGTTTAGRNRNVTIPKRQFIGDSAKVDNQILEEFERKLTDLDNNA